MNTVIIQWKLSNGFLGGLDELEFRCECEQAISLAMPKHLGYVDGGQAGAGTMEIFIEDVADIAGTIAFIWHWLIQNEYLQMCKIVSLTSGASDFDVHYPVDSKFSMWGWEE